MKLKLREINQPQSHAGTVLSKDLIPSLTPKPTLFTKSCFCPLLVVFQTSVAIR